MEKLLLELGKDTVFVMPERFSNNPEARWLMQDELYYTFTGYPYGWQAIKPILKRTLEGGRLYANLNLTDDEIDSYLNHVKSKYYSNESASEQDVWTDNDEEITEAVVDAVGDVTTNQLYKLYSWFIYVEGDKGDADALLDRWVGNTTPEHDL